jgi:hypothetical protein
MIRCRGGATVL